MLVVVEYDEPPRPKAGLLVFSGYKNVMFCSFNKRIKIPGT